LYLFRVTEFAAQACLQAGNVLQVISKQQYFRLVQLTAISGIVRDLIAGNLFSLASYAQMGKVVKGMYQLIMQPGAKDLLLIQFLCPLSTPRFSHAFPDGMQPNI
jgi:hypothetical protein